MNSRVPPSKGKSIATCGSPKISINLQVNMVVDGDEPKETKRYICDLCEKEFQNGKALGGHRRIHLQKVKEGSKIKLNDNSHFDTNGGVANSSKIKKEHINIARSEEIGKIRKGALPLVIRASRTQEDSSMIPPLDLSKCLPAPRWLKTGKRGLRGNSILPSVTEEDEDVINCAYNLMMLASDNRTSQCSKLSRNQSSVSECYDQESDYMPMPDLKEQKTPYASNNKKKFDRQYACMDCEKVFPTYQALGGHRSSHPKAKKMRVEINDSDNQNIAGVAAPNEQEVANTTPLDDNGVKSFDLNKSPPPSTSSTSCSGDAPEVMVQPADHGNNVIILSSSDDDDHAHIDVSESFSSYN